MSAKDPKNCCVVQERKRTYLVFFGQSGCILRQHNVTVTVLHISALSREKRTNSLAAPNTITVHSPVFIVLQQDRLGFVVNVFVVDVVVFVYFLVSDFAFLLLFSSSSSPFLFFFRFHFELLFTA